MTIKRKIGVLTSGGDAPGMNACLKNIVEYSSSKGFEIVAFKHGYQGLIDDDFVLLSPKDVELITPYGGSVIFSGRSKDFLDSKKRKKGMQNLLKHNVEALIVLGGEGSVHGALRFAEYKIPVYLIPCTIDNDISCTERSIGFDTSVNNAVEMINNVQQTMRANDRIGVIETMGRYCGDIALYSAVAAECEVLAIPEKNKTKADIFKYIQKSLDKGKTPTVIVSENLFDVVQLSKEIEKKFKKESRPVILSYMQRGGSPTIFDILLAIRMAVNAVLCVQNKVASSVLSLKNQKIIPIKLEDAISCKKQLNFELMEMFKELNQT